MYGKKAVSYIFIPNPAKKSNQRRKFALVPFSQKIPGAIPAAVIGEYIADFFCHKAGLVIELDGSGHYEPEQMEKDSIRTKYLASQGLKVLRFTNLDIQKNFSAVCEEIDEKVKELC